MQQLNRPADTRLPCQAREAPKCIEELVRLWPWLSEFIEVKNWKITNPHTGTIFETVSSDSSTTHGARCDWALVDELAHIDRWPFVETLMDDMSKVFDNFVLICSNSGFVESDWYRWREMIRESDRWAFFHLNRPPDWMDPAELAEAEKRNPPSRFRRLYYSEPASGGGDAIPADDLRAAIDDELRPMEKLEEGWTAVGGLDLSTRRDDSSCVILAVHNTTGVIRLAEVLVWSPGERGIDFAVVESGIVGLRNRFPNLTIAFDPFAAEYLVQRLREVGVNLIETPFTAANLNRMAVALSTAFTNRNIRLYRDDALISELGRLRLVDRGDFGLKISAPRTAGMNHCDRAIAMSLAMPLASRSDWQSVQLDFDPRGGTEQFATDYINNFW